MSREHLFQFTRNYYSHDQSALLYDCLGCPSFTVTHFQSVPGSRLFATQNTMIKLFKFLEALNDKSAFPTAYFLIVLILAVGAVLSYSVVSSAQPYSYEVKCQATGNVASRILVVSRRTGLTTTLETSPAADGGATIKTDGPFERYEITFDGKPCVLKSR